MQLGTRWELGAEPPPRLPAAMVAAVAAVEIELAGIDTTGWRWTLTWLEGRPIAEMDSGVIVELNADGEVVVRHDPDDEFA